MKQTSLFYCIITEISSFLSKFIAFLSIKRLFLSLKLILLSLVSKLIFTSVVPSSFNNLDIFSISSTVLILKAISLTGLLNKSLREAIFWTFILFNLFSSFEIVLIKVIINEFPSIKISLLSSRMSEKIKSSNTLVKSVNLITP